MRALLALLTIGLALAFGPCADAAVAIINGGGTGGALGTATSAVSANTLAITTGADAPPGTLIVVSVGERGNALVANSCTDNASTPNAYTAAAASLAISTLGSVRVFYAIVTTDLPNGGTITCTFNTTSTSQKYIIAAAFSGMSASPFDATVTATGAAASNPTVTTGTLNFASGGSQALIFSGMWMNVGSGSVTEDTNFTSLGTTGPTGSMHAAFRIVSATTAVTYAPTIATQPAWGVMTPDFKGLGTATSSCPGLLLRGTC
jgi:hypothetical protein